jgi:hypothetical protein
MNNVLDLLIAHHVPWFALAALVLLGISYWPQVRGLWTRGRREGPETLTELRKQLKAVERRQGTLTEPGKTRGQPGTRSSSAKD